MADEEEADSAGRGGISNPTSHRRSSGWYTAAEVRQHCTPQDCWVSLLGIVFDLTNLLPMHPPFLAQPILLHAGEDISAWFDPSTRDVKTRIDPSSRLVTYDTPQGRFIHIPPNSPRTDWNTSYALPWWKDPDYIIGKLSERTRSLRIKNVLIDQEVLLEVPSQEKISQIVERYTALNSHAESYTWKASCVTQRKEFLQLDMDKTLTENGILDEVEEFVALGLPEDFYVPVIHIYYNDDLTVS